MERRVLHVSEADAARDLTAILERVQAGVEVVIERDAQPLAVIRAAAPARRTISECIALAEAHEKETGNAPVLDADFAADVEEIVGNRRPWNRSRGINPRLQRLDRQRAARTYSPADPGTVQNRLRRGGDRSLRGNDSGTDARRSTRRDRRAAPAAADVCKY